jgi:hypothetical protein
VKPSRLLLVLTLANLGLLAHQLLRLPEASAKEDAPMLRARGLELVDDQGRVRVQFKLEPANPTYKWPDGTRVGYPETVIFRLITADGKPRVKLTTSEEGSGLMLLGSSDTTHTVLHAEGTKTSLKLRNDESTQRILAP